MPIVWIALPFLLAYACYGEIRSRRIPNWLTLGGIALGLGAAAIEGGWDGLCDSALGLAIAGGLFLPFCLLGVVGGGDMKLMAAPDVPMRYCKPETVGDPILFSVTVEFALWAVSVSGIVSGSAPAALAIIKVRLPLIPSPPECIRRRRGSYPAR